MVDGCARSLCLVVAVCESKQLGIERNQDAIVVLLVLGSCLVARLILSLTEKVISLLLM